MTRHLEGLVRRFEGDSFFLAHALKLYAQSEDLDTSGLANRMGCSPETLTMLALCRDPRTDSERFHRDIHLIASRFEIQPDCLAEVVRRGQAISRAREMQTIQGTLLAARDAELTDVPRGDEGDGSQ